MTNNDLFGNEPLDLKKIIKAAIKLEVKEQRTPALQGASLIPTISGVAALILPLRREHDWYEDLANEQERDNWLIDYL